MPTKGRRHRFRKGQHAAVQTDDIAVLVVEDHDLVLRALCGALESETGMAVAGSARTLSEGIERCGALHPDVVVTDAGLPDGDAVDEVGRFIEAHDAARVVVLTGWPSERALLEAMGAGAAGFLTKTQPLPDVVAAIRRVAAGEQVVAPELVPTILRRVGKTDGGVGTLTQREIDILHLLAQGASTRSIADSLCVSVKTVRNHIANVMAKLGVHTRLEAVAEALRRSIVGPPQRDHV